ncbi:MAG: alkaline phytoceramidase [Saprospiraceae bacterium]|nr:alkaline phytoceramidase [Saprospiraceae bacterium]
MVTRYRYIILILILASIFAIMAIMAPIPQDPEYHNFADQRTIMGIPNFWDVMSNLPMLFIGIIGLKYSIKTYTLRKDFVTRMLPVILSLGIFCAPFGSAYYHWSPDNFTLMWDRLPMTLMFMPILVLLTYDFMDSKIGTYAFYVLIPLGIFSVLYWHYTELSGRGDLRLYAAVQFGTMLLAPIMILLFYKKTSYINWIWYILGWYILAKIAEYYDPQIYDITGFWSGHTIKHLLGAISLIYVIRLIKVWDQGLRAT